MSRAIYRLVTLLVCVSSILAAPPKEHKDSKITFVKRQADHTPQSHKNNERESRIENLPLTVPTVKDGDQKAVKDVTEQAEEPTNDPPTYNYSDRIYSIKTKAKKNNNAPKSTVAPVEIVDATDKDSPDDADILPLESVQSDTVAKAENSTLKYETEATEAVTEKYEEDLTIATDVDEETTKAPTARYLSKLSHYGKSSAASFSQNLIGNSGKRRFRSRCRCERIWNCAKLQISVPRCPEEYFLCCS